MPARAAGAPEITVRLRDHAQPTTAALNRGVIKCINCAVINPCLSSSVLLTPVGARMRPQASKVNYMGLPQPVKYEEISREVMSKYLCLNPCSSLARPNTH